MITNISKLVKFDFKCFPYEESLFRDPIQVEEWKTAGHHIESTSIDVYQNVDVQYIEIIKKFAHLKDPQVSFHRLRPGHYLPQHKDKYGFYSRKYMIEDIEKIHRIIVFLEDSKDGHLLIVDNTVYNTWKKGDCVEWSGTTSHSAINLGVESRYTMQITGWV